MPSPVLQGLPPLISCHTRVLVLGSFPSVKSLQHQQYYAHPQNQLWRLVFGALLGSSPIEYSTSSYEIRSNCLLELGLGLWDVYAACERAGSLDSAITHARLNDLASLRQRCPQLQAIAHNGAESYKHRQHTEKLGLPVYKLPSSSPANASWSFERKLAVWQNVLQQHTI
jgi:hypoxanthine-DNA glycosylase